MHGQPHHGPHSAVGPGPTTAAGGPYRPTDGTGLPQPAPPPRRRTAWGLALALTAAALGLLALVAVTFLGSTSDDDAAATEVETVDEPTLAPDTTVPSPNTTIAAPTTVPATPDEPEPADADPAAAEDDDSAEDGDSAEDLAGSVVQILPLLNGTPVGCTGSGTIVDVDGTILTNFHVIEQSPVCPHDEIGIAVADSSQEAPELRFVADLLVEDRVHDLAVLRIDRRLDGGDPGTFTPIPVADTDVELGARLRIIGYPGIGGETVTFTEGSVSGFTTAGDQTVLIKTDATIAGGNSGGLAANDAGEIVGVPSQAGTGMGQIVDCRIVDDTNGDGRLDQNDTCVPIGGFINGVRPIGLATPLLEAARTATPIDQGEPPVATPMSLGRPAVDNPVWTERVDANGLPVRPVLAADAGSPELCLTWDYVNVPDGSAFEVIWLIDGVADPSAGVVGTTTGPASSSFFACIGNDDGLADGTYEVIWFVEGEPVFAEAAFVGGERAPIDIEVTNDSGVDICVVQLTPSTSQTFGLNDLDDVLPPGGTVTIPLASGAYAARVIDCDGVVRFEDPVGAVLDRSGVFTVPAS